VLVGAGVLSDLGRLVRERLGSAPSRACLVSDRGLPAPTVTAARTALAGAGFHVSECTLLAEETSKTLSAVEPVLAELLRSRHERTDPIIALGGGIVGDLAGFAAAIYRRGVPVVQCPTTLLAMVDASVGGKTGANLALPAHDTAGAPDLKKNMIGAFHQPALVLADVNTLGSLAPREFRAGLAECVKHAMIAAGVARATYPADPDLFTFLESAAPRIAALDQAALVELVARNVAVKASVVAGDEREEAPDDAGGRALLNLGHTFAHAIETLPGAHAPGLPAPLKHGEAVAIGLAAAARLACDLGSLSQPELDRILALLQKLTLPAQASGLPPTPEVLDRMRHDKKVLSGRLRLIVPDSLGRARVRSDVPEAQVMAAIDSVRAPKP
jgi:3-dehydroquinate synthase